MIAVNEEGVPEGFKLIYGPAWRFGSLQLASRESPAAFWVQARGVIIPRLIRVDLEYAAAFGRGHPDGWDYVVDTRGVRMVHPWNLIELRKLRQLPHLRSWVVIASPGLLATLQRCAPALVRADYQVGDAAEAFELLARQAGEQTAPTTRPENSV